MGPDALRNDGLVQRIEELGVEVEDSGNIYVPRWSMAPPDNPKLKHYEDVLCACRKVRDFVSQASGTAISRWSSAATTASPWAPRRR